MVRSITFKKSDKTIRMSGDLVFSNIDQGPDGVFMRSGVLSIELPSITSFDLWYADFISLKSKAMQFGGKLTRPVVNGGVLDFDFYFDFVGGLDKGYVYVTADGQPSSHPYLKTIQCNPPSAAGIVTIIGDKYFDIANMTATDAAGNVSSKLAIVKSTEFTHNNQYYYNLYRMTAALYNAFNSIADRLITWDPDAPRVGSEDTNNVNDLAVPMFGPKLATLLNYQAVVARWNHNAWKSSLVFDVSENAGATSFILGFINLNCSCKCVRIICKVSYMGMYYGDGTKVETDAGSEDEISALPANYTVYSMGSDTNVKDNVNVSTVMYRNISEAGGQLIDAITGFDTPDMSDYGYYVNDGTGFIGSRGDITLDPDLRRFDIIIDVASPEAAAVFSSEQYHHSAFSLALPTGLLETYSPQTSGDEATRLYHHFSATVKWLVPDGGVDSDGKITYSTFTKEKLLRITAANVTAAGSDEGEE